jgi:hypothetical protein
VTALDLDPLGQQASPIGFSEPTVSRIKEAIKDPRLSDLN